MKSVLTLIAASDKGKLSDTLIKKVSGKLAEAGAIIIGTEWLAQDIACDITFSRIENPAAEKSAHEAIGSLPVDCVAQYTEGRQKRLLISDMDSTIITIECIDEIADFAHVKPQVAAITERAMRGEIDFITALKERVALLHGLNAKVLQDVYEQRLKFMPGARELVATMRSFGAYAVLVSGGFDFFTSRVQKELGFNENSANKLEITDGKLTGNVLEPVLDKQAKLKSLMAVSNAQNINLSDTLAVGDGANDLPMLTAAGLGVAYHAKPVVQQSARARINHCDLTALLYIQGYKEEEIVR
jgi:phosphoserine phosphatase